jgi:tetratricopeptide (TPR) repeat protein
MSFNFSRGALTASVFALLAVEGPATAQTAPTPPATPGIVVTGQNGDFGWREATTKHFIVYGDLSDKEIRNFAERMERFDAAMRQLVKAKETTPVTVYAVKNLTEVQKLAGDRQVGGFYSPSAQGSHMVVPLSVTGNNVVRDIAKTITFHEYAHHMMLSSLDEYYPGWVVEGMAEFFSTADINDDGSVTLGAPNTMRMYSINNTHRWTMEQLITSDTRKVSKDERIERYTRGWALYHYLTLGKKRSNQFARYIVEINKGVPPLEAGQKIFGDLKKLNSEVESYIRQAKVPGATFVPDAIKNGVDVQVRMLPEGEAKIMPSRLRSAIGVTKETAPRVAAEGRKVAAQFPNDPKVQRALAEMEYDANNLKEAEAAADRALAVEPDNLMAMVYKGRVFAKRAKKEGRPELWKEARKWFLKANAQNPDSALPFVLYYDTYVASGVAVPEAATTGLMRAIVIVPQDPSINMRLGYALLQKGDLKTARTVLAPVGFNPERGEENPAKKIIAAIDEGKSQDAVLELAKAEKVDKINDFTDPDELKKDDEKDKGKGKEKAK